MPSDCTREKKNMAFCTCSYATCEKNGLCCECLQYHLRNKQLPACCFPPAVEKTYDRSFKKFIETYK